MIVTAENGDEVVCEILFTHEHKGKNYVVFEFLDTHEVSAAIYIPSSESADDGTFEDVTTDEEWIMLDQLLQEYYDELDDSIEVGEDDDEEEEEALA